MRGALLILAVTCLAIVLSRARSMQAQAGATWLDQQPVVQWNAPGAAIPSAPPAPDVDAYTRCSGTQRPAETAADAQVVAAGWTLVGDYTSGWGISVILATSGYQGMCEPYDYQEFVFADGVFAGTVAPAPMSVASDPALDLASLYPPSNTSTVSGPDTIEVEFARANSGPFCCPTALSVATYTIDRSSGTPTLVLATVDTRPIQP